MPKRIQTCMDTLFASQANRTVKLKDLENKVIEIQKEQLTSEEMTLANDVDNPIGFLQGIYSSIYCTLEQQSKINESKNIIDFSKFANLKKIECSTDNFCGFNKTGLFIKEETEELYISGICLSKTYKGCITKSEFPELTLRLWDIGLKAFSDCHDYSKELDNSTDVIEL